MARLSRDEAQKRLDSKFPNSGLTLLDYHSYVRPCRILDSEGVVYDVPSFQSLLTFENLAALLTQQRERKRRETQGVVHNITVQGSRHTVVAGHGNSVAGLDAGELSSNLKKMLERQSRLIRLLESPEVQAEIGGSAAVALGLLTEELKEAQQAVEQLI